jgi:hypothetical protein
MGIAHILWIYEDGLRLGKSKRDSERDSAALGRAIYSLCDHRDIAETPEGRQLITHKPLFEMGNCVNWCDEAHSSQTKAYLWSGNCLRSASQLEADEVIQLQTLINVEIVGRRKA